jgi:hypothetical protein
MAGAQNKLLALDANILFDLASENTSSHRFREAFLSRDYALLVPPTVVQELAKKANDPSQETSQLARKALTSMLEWGIKPYDLVGVGHGIATRFYERLVKRGMLPEEEKHDGYILAETSLRFIPVLVTCDHHLLDMDVNLLRTQFEDADLFSVVPLHPNTCWRAIKEC